LSHADYPEKLNFRLRTSCRNPRSPTRRTNVFFGLAANPNGHGHNYLLEVSLEGEPTL